MRNSIWQKHLQHKEILKRMFSKSQLEQQNPDKINPAVAAKPAASLSISTIKTKALNGDYAGVIKDLAALGINYVKTVNSNNVNITFNYLGKEYEYVFFGNAMQNPTLETEEPSETQTAETPQGDGVNSHGLIDRPCGGTLLPAGIIGSSNIIPSSTSKPAAEEKSVLDDSWEEMHIPNIPASLLKDYSEEELSAKMDYSKFNWSLYNNGKFRNITFEDENGNSIKIDQYENGQVREKTIEYTDENGNKKTVGMYFDENGKLTQVWEISADGTKINTYYDEEGNICKQCTEIPNANGDGGYTVIDNEYRPDGTCARSERSKKNQRHQTLESYIIDYNSTNGFGPDGKGGRIHHRYGDYCKYEYDEQGRCISQQLGHRRYEYYEDANHNEYDGHYAEDVQIYETRETTYDDNSITYTHRDEAGRITYSETREYWPNTFQYKSTFETYYDKDGNISSTREMKWDINGEYLGETINKYDKEGNIIETIFEKN